MSEIETGLSLESVEIELMVLAVRRREAWLDIGLNAGVRSVEYISLGL